MDRRKLFRPTCGDSGKGCEGLGKGWCIDQATRLKLKQEGWIYVMNDHTCTRVQTGSECADESQTLNAPCVKEFALEGNGRAHGRRRETYIYIYKYMYTYMYIYTQTYI